MIEFWRALRTRTLRPRLTVALVVGVLVGVVAAGALAQTGKGNNNGPHDEWGPGTRIPTLIVSPFLRGNYAVANTEYDTTSAQLRAIMSDIRTHLAAYPSVDQLEPIRVRFLRFGPFSLDIEVFAYLRAADWEPFLELQEERVEPV